MSAAMRIRFAHDMPVAAVEVLSPALDSIERVLLEPGEAREVVVPSEDSFIRVHLPSGRAVALHHKGDLDYEISRADVQGGRSVRAAEPRASEQPHDMHDVVGYHKIRSMLSSAGSRHLKKAVGRDWFGLGPRPGARALGKPGAGPGPLVGEIAARWTPPVEGRLSRDSREAAFTPAARERPYTLEIGTASQTLTISLPGTVDAAYVRVDDLDGDARIVSVRVSTTSHAADALGAYLARGDYYAAEAMARWAEDAEHLLQAKMKDPYAAAMGAYLLLRLERFERMRDWSRNLANWFEFLPDGCVIWAWQNILQRERPEDVRDFLVKAAERGMPVYAEGLRLLSDGLRLLGDEGLRILAGVSADTGAVIWSSPFTARLSGGPEPGEPATTFDIGYMPTV